MPKSNKDSPNLRKSTLNVYTYAVSGTWNLISTNAGSNVTGPKRLFHLLALALMGDAGRRGLEVRSVVC